MSNKQSLSFEKCIHFIFHYFKYYLHLFKPSTVFGSGILSTYKIYVMCDCFVILCADPEGGQGVLNPLKNHKNIGFSSNTGPDPLKNRSYQASIQSWATIDPPAKRHDGPLISVVGSSLP